jgi:hypothetical protein
LIALFCLCYFNTARCFIQVEEGPETHVEPRLRIGGVAMFGEYSSSGERQRYRQPPSPLAEQYEKTRNDPMPEEQVSLKLRLLRWLFSDINKRRAKRYPSPGLVAYYWTGGAPHCYEIANISATGLYLRTKERWAPETLIQMRLQKAKSGTIEEDAEGSISVLSEVVRWGEDGTGFNFVLKDDDSQYGELLPGELIDRKAVEKFIRRMDLAEQS